MEKIVKLTLSGNLLERFKAVKEELGCTTDTEVFYILLNRFYKEVQRK